MCSPSALFVGKTGRYVRKPRATFVPDSATAFAVGEAMQVDALPFECALNELGGSGLLLDVAIYETANAGSPIALPMRLVILRRQQTGQAVHGAYSVPSASPQTFTDIVGVVDIDTTDYVQLDSTHALAVVPAGLDVDVIEGTTLYAMPVAMGAGTYAASATLAIELRVQSD